jgi:hypothetical protein
MSEHTGVLQVVASSINVMTMGLLKICNSGVISYLQNRKKSPLWDSYIKCAHTFYFKIS